MEVAMATVEIESVTMRRGEVTILDDVSLAVDDGEFLVILGASGAGKTALLRAVAGLDPLEEGRVWIAGVDVTKAETANRQIAMVFQENTLYPFMDVRRNISFPLDVAKTPREETAARVAAESRVLEIEHLLSRKPGQLSAGHQQLVQAARALVRVPDVFLMDEPLSRLDAHLRVMMRRELRLLQQGYGTTTLYVTNDPEEAMAVADRMAVMDAGRIGQVGRPLDLYRRPASRTVASVVGNPPMTFVPGRVGVDPPGFWIEIGPLRVRAWDPGLAAARGPVDVGLRPEEVVPNPVGVTGRVVRSQYTGSWALSTVEVAPGIAVPMRTETPQSIGDEVSIEVIGAHVFSQVDGAALGHVETAVS
jgi:ABC-type sugar transport system ATPase subunit